MKSDMTEREKEALMRGENLIQDAINRMRRAYERGTGCHLTADMISAMETSIFGSIWWEDDPRRAGQPPQHP